MPVTREESNRLTTKVDPSQRLLRAAISGLVAAVGVTACDGDSKDTTKSSSQNLSDEEVKSLCADMVKQAASDKGTAGSVASDPTSDDLDLVCKDKVEDAKKSVAADTDTLCADAVKTATDAALKPKSADEKTISSEQKEYTFAQLTKMCDDRHGYTEIHAACGGQNTCKGFSYGDWGPDAATLTEHSCTGVNGCLGLSCVVGVDDQHGNKTGEELYALKFDDGPPNACNGCHAELDPDDHDKKDLTKFYVYIQPGSTRTAKNWLDVPAADQERKVFFGAHYTDGHGREIQNMAAYNQALSRGEIERLVAHIRTLTPLIQTMKVVDP